MPYSGKRDYQSIHGYLKRIKKELSDIDYQIKGWKESRWESTGGILVSSDFGQFTMSKENMISQLFIRKDEITDEIADLQPIIDRADKYVMDSTVEWDAVPYEIPTEQRDYGKSILPGH